MQQQTYSITFGQKSFIHYLTNNSKTHLLTNSNRPRKELHNPD